MVPPMQPEPRIVTAGSRELAVADAGPDSGFPILMMNGAGSRHLFPPAVREGQEQGFRLIGYDRPGCGGSTSLPGRRIGEGVDRGGGLCRHRVDKSGADKVRRKRRPDNLH